MKKFIKALVLPMLLFVSLSAGAQSRNQNGTVPLKDLSAGQSRQRADGSVDKVHKDGGGYTHTYIDKGGNKVNQPIRFDQNSGREIPGAKSVHPRDGGQAVVIPQQPRQQTQQYDGRQQQQQSRPYSSGPAVNQNGTVKLNQLAPGQSRVRADGTTDKVHKDGGGYTHSYVDRQGERHNESIRYDSRGQERKISDTEHRNNGQVVTQYRNGNIDVRGSDGLRSRRNNSGGYVYQERRETWNNQRAVYRDYQNNYRSVYIENNYYGSPVYFYRPSVYGYSDYVRVLSPWSRPTQYAWEWNYNSRYRGYYSPYAVYSTPSQWLTDYMIMSLIQSRFERVLYNDDVYSYTQGTGSLDSMIRDEIRLQVEQSLRYQQTAVQFNSSMDPSNIIRNGRLMVADEAMYAVDQNGNQCVLDESDVVRIVSLASVYEGQAQVRVVSAKRGSCYIGSYVSVSMENLIDMENEFQSRIQLGMREMRSRNLGF